MDLSDQFRGCLLGGAVGDALGMPTEVGPSRSPGQSIRDALGVEFVDTYLDSPNPDFLKAGQYTDDTQQAICLAETLLEGGGEFSPVLFVTKLDRAIRGRMRGVGPSTMQLLTALAEGRLDQIIEGRLVSRQPTNGAAMRIAPVALLFHDDPMRMKSECLRVGGATHRHPTSLAGAAAIARAIAFQLARPATPLDGDAFRREVASFIEDIDPELAAMIASGRTGHGDGCLVVDTIPVVLEAFIARPGDYLAGVLAQVNSNGDTDTKASMLGNLLGARNGVRAIPDVLLDGLEHRDHIEEFASRLYRLNESG